jgi:hypothetical protein
MRKPYRVILLSIILSLSFLCVQVLNFDGTYGWQRSSQETLQEQEQRLSLPTKSVSYYNATLLQPLLDLSRAVVHPPSNTTAVVCLKTIFGAGRAGLMNHVLRFVAYNRLLGFDEVMVWYMANFKPEGFEQLQALPYVTLIENTRSPEWKPGAYDITAEHPGGQKGDINECLKRTKGKFDWVFIADWDEFLWFSGRMRLKSFLQLYGRKNYLSFGKWMYSAKDWVDTKEDLFGLEKVGLHVVLLQPHVDSVAQLVNSHFPHYSVSIYIKVLLLPNERTG